MIELTVVGANRPALIDDDMAHLARYSWRLHKDGYVCRKSHGNRIYLHQVVLPGDRYPDFVRDHISRDKLDNRSENLRWLTLAESTQNRDVCKRNATGIRGVRFDDSKGMYLARVQSNGKAIIREWFHDPDEAAKFLAARRSTVLPFAA